MILNIDVVGFKIDLKFEEIRKKKKERVKKKVNNNKNGNFFTVLISRF
jgi:hypothetical protein